MTRRWTMDGAGKRALTVLALALMGVGVGARPAPARMPRFHELISRIAAFASDGTRYAAWQQRSDAAVIVYDARTRKTRVFRSPVACALPEDEKIEGARAADGRFLLECDDGTTRLLEMPKGTIRLLPAPAGPLDSAWNTIGSRYIEGTADPHTCGLSPQQQQNGELCVALYEIGSRTLTYRSPPQPANLDQGTVCGRLRALVLAEQDAGASEGQYAFDGNVFARPRSKLDGIEVIRCRSKSRILHAGGEPENLVLRDGILTWDTAAPASAYNREVEERPGYGFLWTYQLSTGRRTHTKLPEVRIDAGVPHRAANTLGYSTHAGDTLFWVAAQTITASHGGYAPVKSTVFAAHV